MNLILRNSKYVDYYTYLRVVLNKVSEFRNIKWVISGNELNSYLPGYENEPDYIEIGGAKLAHILNGMEHEPQFIWAVLSGYNITTKIRSAAYPTADGNERYWVRSPAPESENAICEIVCLDSSCTLYIGINSSISEKIKKIFPDIKDLDVENTNRLTSR